MARKTKESHYEYEALSLDVPGKLCNLLVRFDRVPIIMFLSPLVASLTRKQDTRLYISGAMTEQLRKTDRRDSNSWAQIGNSLTDHQQWISSHRSSCSSQLQLALDNWREDSQQWAR